MNEVRELREKLRITQEQLSRLCGFTVQTISKIENGKGAKGVAYKAIMDALAKLELEEKAKNC